MAEHNVTLARAYYKAMNDKDLSAIAKFFDPNIQFTSPMGTLNGKEAILANINGFITAFKSLAVNFACGSNDQVLLVYTLELLPSMTKIKVASHITIKDGLIISIELFYDPRPFMSGE